MKKVKIMLMSLALLAVVGGALAFKAKYIESFCTTTAYFDVNKGYYCSYTFNGGTQTTTKLCPNLTVESTWVIDDANPLITKVCTTEDLEGDCPGELCHTRTYTIRVNN